MSGRSKGTCSVYQDGDRWGVALELPKTPEGQRRRRRWTFHTRKAALDKAKTVPVA